MRTLLVFDVEIDEGKRPSTRFRRVDSVVRSTGGFLRLLRPVKVVYSISVGDPAALELLSPELRYDGRQVAPPLDQLPVGIEVL
ncbi:MAG TPA: hypothetical protein VMX37_01695 [Acidimicrobiia bacterium]|nr:hypothetical protein [Acidimicrobiia bacterium]